MRKIKYPLFVSLILVFGARAFAQNKMVCPAKGEQWPVAIEKLHPTQPNVGLGEVLKKADDLATVDPTVPSLDDKEPVPVVVGPDGELYVSDHHHFVFALRKAKGPAALVRVKALENKYCGKCSFSEPGCAKEFWKHLAKKHRAYLCDINDKPISYKLIPASFDPDASPIKLENDPYRTLVNVLRKKKPTGSEIPCLVRPDAKDPSAFFWEFRMAEKIRRHIPEDKDRELRSKDYATASKFKQDMIDAACTAWTQDTSDESCAATIAEPADRSHPVAGKKQ